MATIKSTLQLYDGMTGPLRGITTALNTCISTFETMESVSASPINVAGLQSARESLAQVDVAINQIGDEIERNKNKQNGFNGALGQGASAADGLLGKLKGMASAYVGIQGAKKVIELSDNMTQTDARLNLIVDDGGSVDELKNKIMQSAQDSRASYLDTASAISKMGLMAGDAFNNNDELITFTETLNKQFAIAGTDAAGASAATLQLTQAMASGVLRGEELNSVFEQAPNVIQSIADYLDVPIGSIREMASEGEITADIVKKAMLASADSVNETFEQLPMTWAQVWTNISNGLLQTFEPLIQAVGKGAQFISDNWGAIEPIFWGLAAAAGAYAVALGIQTVATWAADGAAKAFFTTLLANPLTWIVLAVGLLVVAIYKWVQSVGGLKIAWMICMNAIMTKWDEFKVAGAVIAYFIADKLANMCLGFKTAKTNVINFMGDMKAGALGILQDMLNSAIEKLNWFIDKINMIPGVNLEFIQSATFAADAALQNEANKALRNQELADYQADIQSEIAGRQEKLGQMYNDYVSAKEAREAAIEAARNEAAASGDSTNDLGNALEDIYGDTGSIADNTSDISDAVQASSEELKYLRDIAERKAINEFTTAEIQVVMNNTNQIDSDQDIDGIISLLEEGVEEAMLAVSEGAHT